MKENGIILGQLLSILVNLFDPGVVYIGGMIAPIFEKICPIAKKEVEKRMIDKERGIDILCDNSGDKIIIAGAAEMVFDRWMP